jgi:hypothetical protein
MKMSQRICSVLLVASTVALTGCAGYRLGQRSWDPPAGRSMFEQLPAWDLAAEKRCGGHLLPHQRSPVMTDRC